jgi:hypothetical protein
MSESEQLKLFTELLNKLRESGFVVGKAKYDLLNTHMAGFEVHATYKEGNVTWFFVFECSLSGVCKVKEEDVDVEVTLDKQSADVFINTAFDIITSVVNAQKDMRLLAEKIRQVLGEDAGFEDLKTKIFLSKYYGKSLNHGLLQTTLLPRKVKINVEVLLASWDEAKLLLLIKHLNDVLQLEGFKNQVS